MASAGNYRQLQRLHPDQQSRGGSGDTNQVRLEGDTNKYDAKVVGVDVDTDLAVIKIEASRELPFAKLGNSDGVQVGDWVWRWAAHFD